MRVAGYFAVCPLHQYYLDDSLQLLGQSGQVGLKILDMRWLGQLRGCRHKQHVVFICAPHSNVPTSVLACKLPT